MMNICTKFN